MKFLNLFLATCILCNFCLGKTGGPIKIFSSYSDYFRHKSSFLLNTENNLGRGKRPTIYILSPVDYLPLTGGTLTGVLEGTKGIFSDAVYTTSSSDGFRSYSGIGSSFASFRGRANGKVEIYGWSGSQYGDILLGVDSGFAGGNVGIGLESPNRKLVIQESNNEAGIVRLQRGFQGSEPLLGNSFGNPYLQIGGEEYRLGSIQTIGFGYTQFNGSMAPAEIGFETRTTGGFTYGDIVFANRNSTDNTAPVEVVRITHDGNMGIGISSPNRKFVVHEANSINGVVRLQRGPQGIAPLLSSAYGTPYLQIGGEEYKLGSIQTIGFGYTQSAGSIAPAEIGFETRSTGGFTYGDIVFANRDNVENTAPVEVLRITHDGKVGIGTVNPAERLTVNGSIRAKKVSVTQSSWPDYVFEPDYILPSLSTLSNFIKLNKRLPEIPSAKEVQEKGVDLGATQALLLKKIEELTLHLIELDQKNTKLEAQNKGLEKRLQKLENR